MLELIVFAIVLAVSQAVSAYVMMLAMTKHFMSKEFIKKTGKEMMETMKELTDEWEEEF